MDAGKNLILVSYVIGSFGSALVNLLTGSNDCHGKFMPSRGQYWHSQPWTFPAEKYAGGFITKDTKIDLPPGTVKYRIVQFHNTNADTLQTLFPGAKIIMLAVDQQQFYFSLQRWWRVIGFDQHNLHNSRIDQVCSAFDVIVYNTDYYNNHGTVTRNNDSVFTVKFDSVASKRIELEQFLGITLVPQQVELYQEFVQKQLAEFYQWHDNFEFALTAIQHRGNQAPIVDLAHEFATTQDLKNYFNEQE